MNLEIVGSPDPLVDISLSLSPQSTSGLGYFEIRNRALIFGRLVCRRDE